MEIRKNRGEKEEQGEIGSEKRWLWINKIKVNKDKRHKKMKKRKKSKNI